MKPIKAKAWIKSLSAMAEVLSIDIGQGALIRIFEKNIDGVTKWFPFDDLEILWFTGCYDRNKIEIYAGDIRKIKLPMNGFWGNIQRYEIAQVRYEADFGGFICEWAYSRHQHHIRLDCDIAFESEYLGNIYEHSNLLPN